jgi:protein-tyrosine phosphatase
MDNDHFPNEIIPGHLYLSSRLGAQDRTVLRELNIFYILDARPAPGELAKNSKTLGTVKTDDEIENVNETEAMQAIERMWLGLHDSEQESILPAVERGHQFIEDAKRNGKSVLVHCELGISRSASVVLSYLMKYHNMTFKQAWQHTKERRRIILPNHGYMRQLQAFEIQIYGKTTVELGKYGQIKWLPDTNINN